MSAKSLYVHIPFCNVICSYCDFTKLYYKKDWAEKYISALLYEISSLKKEKMNTIYIGGGTPSSLDIIELNKLLVSLDVFVGENTEFTFEANPESLDEEKIKLLKKHCVNRVSLGVQSSNEKYLKLLNRNHSFGLVKEKINLLRRHGISNINVDLIYALPEQSITDLEEDLENFISLDVPHISTYSLILEKSTVFFNQGIKEASEDTQADFYNLIVEKLRAKGYIRYEVSNFAKDNYFSKHNLTYWHNEEYYGVGLGASGYLNNIRYTNSKNLHKYLDHEFVDYKEVVNKDDLFKYFLLTNLRLSEGFNLDKFKEIFKFDFLEKYKDKISDLEKYDLVLVKNGNFMCSDKGILVLDKILLNFF
ncbi:MAG: radical SAM family heme chaperone HemW [Bacilli bacterium]|nr:radical SAM family heme chaperone HemW [Bacilli bacterium]